MANTLAGGKTMVFSVADVPYGYIQSYNVDKTTERAEAKGPNGHTYAIQEYNEIWQLTLEYLEFATQTGNVPTLGTKWVDTEAITGVTAWYISSANYGRSVDGFKTVTITATYYPDLGTPDP